jgi:copper chaperone CopZ
MMAQSVSFQELRLPIQGMICGGCATTVRRALTRLPGVQEALVDLPAQQAQVTYNPALVGLAEMVKAVTKAGYTVQEETPPSAYAPVSPKTVVPSWQRPLFFGLLGMAGLMLLYLALVTLAEGWNHALDLLLEDAWLVGPIMVGFGVQVGLYSYLKTALHVAGRGTGALTGAGGGASTAAMVACCAHHVTDVLPLLGLTTAATFLAEYRVPFMLVGLAMNLIGIGVISFLIIRQRRCLALACVR